MAMQRPVAQIVLLARQLDVQELQRLAEMTQVVETVGRLIHALQAERGASAIFLATKGSGFADMRRQLVADAEAVERALRALIEPQAGGAAFGKAKLLHLMAWVLLGLGELPALRARIGEHALAAEECIAAYSRLIAGLVALIFEAADSSVDPRTSSLLVALFNLVQGKEFAGQERAVGALAFSSGRCDAAARNRLQYLVDAQARHFAVFAEFAGGPLREKWQAILEAPHLAHLERLRRTLGGDPGRLDVGLIGAWFEVCSERLSAIWSLQCAVVQSLKAQCAALVAEAEAGLRDSGALIEALCANPPAQAGLASRVFDSAIPVEDLVRFRFQAGNDMPQGQAIMDVLHAQSQRLIGMETELAAARRALDERKTIERAKGMLMARFHLSEGDAYKRMRTAAMEQNKRLVEVAEAILMLVTLS